MAKKSSKAAALHVELVPINSVKPDPENARLHPDRNLEAIKVSLEEFGQQQPIIVDQDNVVVVGNARLAAAKALGWTEIQVVRTKLTGAQRTAFAIADNRTGELAEWDPKVLADALKMLHEAGALDSAGFTADEMASFADMASADELSGASAGGVRTVEGKAVDPNFNFALTLMFNGAQWADFEKARDAYRDEHGTSDVSAIVHGICQQYVESKE